VHGCRLLLVPGVLLGVSSLGGCTATTPSGLPTSAAPAAAFAFSPSSPAAAQAVQFTDATTGGPTGWAWTFGDGASSALQHPTHAYLAAGSYEVTLRATNGSGSGTATRTVTVGPGIGGDAFRGTILLGSPTAHSIKANVYSPDQGGAIYLAYGTAPGGYALQTPTVALPQGTPTEVALDGLEADRRYYYRLHFQAAGLDGFTATDEYSFHTARPPGSTFTFAVQGDSHPERDRNQFDAELYRRTLATAAADGPDFYLAIGDDFSVDTLDPATVDAARVTERYTLQRPYLGIVGRSAPLFLVNGNHEQAARYLLDGTPSNVAVWAQNARNAHYSQPAPDDFYSGNPEVVPHVGLLRNFFAWTWGDALFVVLDPYWASPTCVDAPFGGGPKRTDLWEVTHGDLQYQWLRATLEQSPARFKFVFAHHVLGTDRGGVELAGGYEWGGRSGNGTWDFGSHRPTWPAPVHQLMAATGVTIFFQGHDHVWVRQALDGIVYQTLSEPADPYYALYNADAYLTGERFPNTGYTRVTVAPSGVKVDYVRTYRPQDEGPGARNGDVAYTYTVP
jgi:PKD repeat protein